MLRENTAPGYCRLQLLLPSAAYREEDGIQMLLKNSFLHGIVKTQVNGPAQTIIDEGGFEHDMVAAYRCMTWPREAREWIKRRRGDWPSPCLIQKCIQGGCFVVPVGSKLSDTPDLEWRISLSLAERYLMFSLNMTQIKVYVVLKMLVKTFITPVVGKTISSFHCKTALFFCIEDTGTGLWKEENLVECILLCLSKLHVWVTESYCPLFEIPCVNLFTGKVSQHNRDTILQSLHDMIASQGMCLFNIKIDELGDYLRMNLSKPPSTVFTPISTVRLVGVVELQTMTLVNSIMNDIVYDKVSVDTVTLVQTVHSRIILCGHISDAKSRGSRRAAMTLIQFLSCWLGSLLASISLENNEGVPLVAFKWFLIGTRYDFAACLKFASVLYCGEIYKRAEMILLKLETKLQRVAMQSICSCYGSDMRTQIGFWRLLYDNASWKKRSGLVLPCVWFCPQESHCVPAALRLEMNRDIGADDQHSRLERWMDLAVVDCRTYLYFLQYLTYKQLGKTGLQSSALHNLEQCIGQDSSLHHAETALNLLGQCMEMEQNTQAAMECYRASLKIRPQDNVAKSHVQSLSDRRIRCTNGFMMFIKDRLKGFISLIQGTIPFIRLIIPVIIIIISIFVNL